MNCEKYKNEITELFGSETLTEELRLHIDDCENCREFYNEMLELEKSVENEQLFYPSEVESERIIRNVETILDRNELGGSEASSPLWKSFVPAAAAVILIVGFAGLTNVFNYFIGDKVTDGNDITDTIVASVDDNLLNEEAYLEMLNSYLSESDASSTDWLLENITDEELLYLEQNFDVGEIL